MVNPRAYMVGTLAWSLVCLVSSCSKAPPTGAENPRQPAAAPLPISPPKATTTEEGAATPAQPATAPSDKSSPEAAEQPTAAGAPAAGTAETPRPKPPMPEPDAAPGPEPEQQHDGVRTVPRVAMSKRRAAAGNGRSFARPDIFWASGRPLTLDIIHHRPGEFEALEAATRAAVAAKETADTDDDDIDIVRLTSHAALRTVRVGEPLTLVGRTGPRSAEVASFSAWPGASDAHLNVELKPEIRAAGQALALRGAVAPDARLLQPKPVVTPSSAVKTERRRLRGLISGPGRGRPMRSSVASIRTPVAGSQLLTVSIPRKDEDDEYDGFSGLLVVEPTGTTHVLVEPDHRYHQMRVLHLVDVDGDGVDEVIFESDYFESSGYVYLAVWNGRGYMNLQLSGDGG